MFIVVVIFVRAHLGRHAQVQLTLALFTRLFFCRRPIEAGGTAAQAGSRSIWKPAKDWLTGMISSRLTLTCGGSAATQNRVSAMSSAVIGLAPLYVFSEAASLPPVRTSVNSVSAMPGSIEVTRTPLPCRSDRRPSENCRTKALVAP